MHVSQLADKFVKDAKEVVKAGQIVTVRVLEVNEDLKRISLSMEKSGERPSQAPARNIVQTGTHKPPSIEDLAAKFNTRRK